MSRGHSIWLESKMLSFGGQYEWKENLELFKKTHRSIVFSQMNVLIYDEENIIS